MSCEELTGYHILICHPVTLLSRHQADYFPDNRIVPFVQPLPCDIPRKRRAEYQVFPGYDVVRQPALRRFQPGVMQFAQPVMEEYAISVFLSCLNHRNDVRYASQYQSHTPQRGCEPFLVAGFQEAQDILGRAEAGSTALLPAPGAPAFHGLASRLADDALQCRFHTQRYSGCLFHHSSIMHSLPTGVQRLRDPNVKTFPRSFSHV